MGGSKHLAHLFRDDSAGKGRARCVLSLKRMAVPPEGAGGTQNLDTAPKLDYPDLRGSAHLCKSQIANIFSFESQIMLQLNSTGVAQRQ